MLILLLWVGMFKPLYNPAVHCTIVFLFQDTDVVVWDIINESGLYRLRGHKGMISQAQFLATKNILITRYSTKVWWQPKFDV